ncbi:uncharacterized protein LOC128656660 isoform X2 [Bombina bombina]|nr:uncharacterized protein LOC128656660 isoform X2 [Bombina bombina]
MELSPQTETLAVTEQDEMEEQHGTIHQKETVTMDSMQQVETKKKKQTKEKRQKANNSEVPEKLLTELPFANVDIGALFDITRKSEKTVKKKRKRKLLLEDEDDDTSKKKTRANYFISIPISNPKILQDIQTFQNAVLEKDERLSKVMIPKGSFHITLFVMHLATEEETNLAISALLDCKEPVGEILQEKTLIFGFDGVSDFKNQVVYGKIIENDSVSTLKEMTDTLVKIFKEKGLSPMGLKSFVPHLTFMKLSRAPKLRKQGLKKIDPGLYESFNYHNFGDEVFHQIDLCSMVKKRQPNGYYHTEATIYFGSTGNLQSALTQSDGDQPLEPYEEPVSENHPTSVPFSEHANRDIVIQNDLSTSILTNADNSDRAPFIIPGECSLTEYPECLRKKDVNDESKMFTSNDHGNTLEAENRDFGQDGSKEQDEHFESATSKFSAAFVDQPSISSPTPVVNLAISDNFQQKPDRDCTVSDIKRQTPVKDLPEPAHPTIEGQGYVSQTESVQQNSQPTHLHNQAQLSSHASIADLVYLQRQSMLAEQEHWERNEQNMCLLLERLTSIQEQQKYTNVSLMGISSELSFIGKQLSMIAQHFQLTAGVSTMCHPVQSNPGLYNTEEKIEQSSAKEDSTEDENISQDCVKDISDK